MKNITLIAAEFQWHDLTRYSIEQTLKHIDPAEVVIISDREVLPGARHVQHAPTSGMAEYANLILKGMAEHVNTSHAIYVQWDGMAYDRTQWTPEFLEYDYIGAPWPWMPAGQNVGNGGFSLRSRRLLDAIAQDPNICLTPEIPLAEDNIIAVSQRTLLETQYGIKYANADLASQFSYEIGTHRPSLGFHGLWNVFNLLDDDAMDYYTENISYSGWNIYKWHHTLAAVLRRDRGDLYEHMLSKLIDNNSEMVQPLAEMLEYANIDSTQPLVIS